MMEEELTEEERAQMRKFAALQKVAGGILSKWSWLLTSLFVFLTALFSVILVWLYAKSEHRFDATTRLMYNPRKVTRVDNISDKQLMTILERTSLKRRVGELVQMQLAEKECLSIDLEVVQERKPANLFTLTAHSPTWVGAVRKVNAYAEVLIDEYIKFRREDLDNWRSSILLRKNHLQKQIADLESEETIAKGKTGVASPVETLTTLNQLISDQRRNLSMLSVEVANEEVKRRKLEKSVGDIGPAIIASASLIRKKSAQIAEMDKELAGLRQVYTDLNPKVKGKIDDRLALVEDYVAILKERGIEGISIDDVERVEKAASELADVSLRIEVLAENQRSLEQEIKSNEERSAILTEVIPSIERLRIRRDDLERTMRDLDDQLEDIAYLQMSVENDLQQIERAGGAGDKNPLRVKNFIFAAGGAAICTCAVGLWILMLEFVSGKVRGAAELAAWGDVTVVGSIPKADALPEDEERDVMGVVALNFCNVEIPKQVILVCRLPGVLVQKKFAALDWSLSMAGQRHFVLEIVPSVGFEPPEDCKNSLINVVHNGTNGYFPVANRYSLAPTELQMLQADLDALKGDFENIFVLMPGGLRKGGSFFSQILGVCDSAFIFIAADKTPRQWLAYTRRHITEVGKPMIGLVTGASASVVRKEMESHK